MVKYQYQYKNSIFFQTIQCPDCPLKFPLKAALKYHQEMAHQVCITLKSWFNEIPRFSEQMLAPLNYFAIAHSI